MFSFCFYSKLIYQLSGYLDLIKPEIKSFTPNDEFSSNLTLKKKQKYLNWQFRYLWLGVFLEKKKMIPLHI